MGSKKSLFRLTDEQVERRIKEGRGQGTKEDYIPWHLLTDVSSKGKSGRYQGIKIARPYHLFSGLENKTWLMMGEWADCTFDCREQFPLLPREETLEIAKEIGVKHPKSRSTGADWVLTTDLLLTLGSEEQPYQVAKSVKPVSALKKKRVLELLEIERRYWQRRNVLWYLVTDRDIPEAFVWNIKLVRRKVFQVQNDGLDQGLLNDILSHIEGAIFGRRKPLREITTQCDKHLNLKTGFSLNVVYFMIATKQWDVDMYKKINPAEPLAIIG